MKEILAVGGYITVNALGGGLNNPGGVGLDANGNLFVADTGNNTVKEILAAGGYTTVSTLGSGFNHPEGVTVDGSGNVFIGDSMNHAVARLDFADPPSLSFASTLFGSTSSDSPQTITMTNSGNVTLNFPVPLSGLNPGIGDGFVISNTSTCPQLTSSSSPATLAPGSSCINLISFTPTTVGSISGSLAMTDDNLNAAGPGYATQSISLSGIATAVTPTIVFTIPNHNYGDASFTVGATSNSIGAFTYSVVSGPASLTGSTVTLTGTGTVVLQASQAADANYLAATQNATFTVAAATPTISFTVPNHNYGDASFTVGATSNSTGAFTYSVVSGPASLTGSTVTLTGTGTVVLQASQAADANYLAATQNATFTVAAIAPTISFSIPNHNYGDASFTVGATSNSTGTLTYSVVSGPASLTGSTVTLTGTGTVVLQASQAADANYLAATQNATFTVAAIVPTISFSIPPHNYGDVPFTVAATSNSTGTLTYSVVSGPASLTGSTVTLTGTGTVILQASQAADANYLAATQNATFTVAAIVPTISFTFPTTITVTLLYRGRHLQLHRGIHLHRVSGPATIAGSTITLTGTGTVVLQASQAADANYLAAAQTVTFTVTSINPTISFTVPNHSYGNTPFAVGATSNSTGAFTYTVVSGPATIAGSTITLTGTGTVVFRRHRQPTPTTLPPRRL